MITFWLGGILFAGVGMWAVMPTFWFVLRRLKPVEADGARVWPRVSIIVPACNEEGAVESSVRSLLALEYPNYEVIAVNDRSTDATGAIMDQVAADSEHCRVVHVSELPEGWLGKNHAMHLASTEATGDLLLFTDGDVIHEPAALRSAVDFAERKKLQHLCLLPRMIPGSYFEDSLVAFFGFAFAIGQQVHVMVAGVTTLRSGSVVLPEDLTLGVTDGENVFPIGSTDQNETFVVGLDSGPEKTGQYNKQRGNL